MRPAVALMSVVLILAGASGCTGAVVQPTTASSPAATTTAGGQSVAVTEVVPSEVPSAATPASADVPPAGPRISPESLAYAKRIGGSSHKGERLYFVIGDSVESESEAQSLLDDATPRFGDMQSYFIVQRSDNFEGMRPGWWVIIEAYRKPPSAENQQFGKRGFPEAYVKQAVVLTDDPIPVYDDLVPK